MRYLCFQNKGNIDLYNLILMGASTKRGDNNKIGEYGSGWKYAISTSVRNNVDLRIITGTGNSHIGIEYAISTKAVPMNGVMFNMILVNGKEAMFTDALGPDWELWMAIREIYCNAIDEGSTAVNILSEQQLTVASLHMTDNKTLVAVEITDAVQEIIDSFQDYFSFERTDDIMRVNGCTVYKKRGINSIIYRKGIQVAVSTKKGCYDYDFDNIPINEIRQAKNFSDVQDALKYAMKNNIDAEVLNTILTSEDTWEKELNFYAWESISHTQKPVWEKVIGKRVVVPQEYTTSLVKKDTPADTILKLPAMLSQLISLQLPEKTVLGYDKNGDMCINQELTADDMYAIELALAIVKPHVKYTYRIKKATFNNSYTKSSHSGIEINIAHHIIEHEEIAVIALLIFKEATIIETGHKNNSSDLEDYLFKQYFNHLAKID